MILIYATKNSPKLKCKFAQFQACEKCDKNSKMFYEIETKKFCPRCTLGYLSYNFASQSINEIKFYCADILFHFITDPYAFKHKKNITWKFINDVVSEKMNKEKSILHKRKIANQSFDLFVLTNEILTKMKQNLLEKSKCSKCSNPRFHLIKLICSKKFICNPCFDQFHIGKLNCELCKTRCNNIRPQNKHFRNWIIRPGYGAMIFNAFANVILQFLMLLPYMNTNYCKNMFSLTVNFVAVSKILENTSFMTYYDDLNLYQNIPKNLYENINIIFTGFTKVIVTWLNILLGFYLGEPYLTYSILYLFFTIPITSSILYEIKKKIFSYVEEEIRYEFL